MPSEKPSRRLCTDDFAEFSNSMSFDDCGTAAGELAGEIYEDDIANAIGGNQNSLSLKSLPHNGLRNDILIKRARCRVTMSISTANEQSCMATAP